MIYTCNTFKFKFTLIIFDKCYQLLLIICQLLLIICQMLLTFLSKYQWFIFINSYF